LTSCSPGEPKAADKPKDGGLMPVSQDPREQLDEQRLENATRGLSFNSGVVTVTTTRAADRAKSISASQVAEKSFNVDNTWFKAAGLFRDAILADPSYAVPYEGLARSFLLEGKVNYAEAALKTAVSLDPNFNKARFELGVVRQKQDDNAGAVSIWKELVKRDPAYPDAYARMAVSSYFAQDFKAAWTYLDEADKRKQNVPPQFRDLLKEVAPRP
jgi:tetratricopeptide (TPR) repeat protein